MIWDIITWRGLLRGVSLPVRQERRFFFLSFVQPCLVEMADIGLYGSRGLKRSKLKNADNSETCLNFIEIDRL